MKYDSISLIYYFNIFYEIIEKLISVLYRLFPFLFIIVSNVLCVEKEERERELDNRGKCEIIIAVESSKRERSKMEVLVFLISHLF